MTENEGLGQLVEHTAEAVAADPLVVVRPVVRKIYAARTAASAELARAVEVALRNREGLAAERVQNLETVLAWLRGADYERQLAGEFPGYREGLTRADELQRAALELAATECGFAYPPI